MKGHLLLQLCRARCMTRCGCSATMALFYHGRGVVVCPPNSPQVCCPWSAPKQSQTPASAPSGVPARLRGPRARRPRHRTGNPSTNKNVPVVLVEVAAQPPTTALPMPLATGETEEAGSGTGAKASAPARARATSAIIRTIPGSYAAVGRVTGDLLECRESEFLCR